MFYFCPEFFDGGEFVPISDSESCEEPELIFVSDNDSCMFICCRPAHKLGDEVDYSDSETETETDMCHLWNFGFWVVA